jgi:hypothetical protein
MKKILLCLGLMACSKTLVIESNTTWRAAIGTSTVDVATARSVQGSGNRTIAVDAQTVCWTVQKTTQSGVVRAYLSSHSIIGIDTQSDASTTADFGLVAGCVQ